MHQFLTLLVGAIVWLFGLVTAAIGVIEGAARQALTAIGITGELQSALLLVLLLLLIVAAFRLFGRLFAILIGLVLLILLLHALLGTPSAGLAV